MIAWLYERTLMQNPFRSNAFPALIRRRRLVHGTLNLMEQLITPAQPIKGLATHLILDHVYLHAGGSFVSSSTPDRA
jgi:hypothetical protein